MACLQGLEENTKSGVKLCPLAPPEALPLKSPTEPGSLLWLSHGKNLC